MLERNEELKQAMHMSNSGLLKLSLRCVPHPAPQPPSRGD